MSHPEELCRLASRASWLFAHPHHIPLSAHLFSLERSGQTISPRGLTMSDRDFRYRTKTYVSDKNVQVLISFVQRYPNLWNDDHPEFKDSRFSRKLWEEIATRLDISGIEAKKKWKSLKDTYRKIFKSKPPGLPPAHFTPQWRFWKPLSFLQEIFAANRTDEISTIKEETSSQSDSNDNNYIEEIGGVTHDSGHDEKISVSRSMPSEIPSDREEGSNSQNITIQDILLLGAKRKRSDDTEDENTLPLEQHKLYPVISMHHDQHKRSEGTKSNIEASTSQEITMQDILSGTTKRNRTTNSEGGNTLELQNRNHYPIISMQHQDEKRNDNYLFLMSILPYMEKLPDLQKLELRTDIQNLVLKYYRQSEGV